MESVRKRLPNHSSSPVISSSISRYSSLQKSQTRSPACQRKKSKSENQIPLAPFIKGEGTSAKGGAEGGGFFRRDQNGTIQENLIIKGNNLLALHSIKKEFAGKVKLIYIDPPYNTGSDSFKYNDNFNHSTWLVFMKNRLEVAKELLRDDGVIFVQCDDNEQAYLKVLMDEVFKNYFLNTIIVKAKATS
jgi:hypothetical protein